MNYREYWKGIRDLAKDVVSEVADDVFSNNDNRDLDYIEECIKENIWDYALFEYIDQDAWVLYPKYHMSVMEHTDNIDNLIDSFGVEDAGQILKDKGLDGLHTAIVFWAIYADVVGIIDETITEYMESLC